MDDYSIRGRDIFSPKGKLVATLDDDGNPVMAPGMAGPHSRGVREFLADVEGRRSKVEGGNGGSAGERGPSQSTLRRAERNAQGAGREVGQVGQVGRVGQDQGQPDQGESTGEAGQPPRNTEADVPPGREAGRVGHGTGQPAAVDDIPEDRLPPFSPEFGTATPGFAEFVERHRITPEQIAALVKRCENRKP